MTYKDGAYERPEIKDVRPSWYQEEKPRRHQWLTYLLIVVGVVGGFFLGRVSTWPEMAKLENKAQVADELLRRSSQTDQDDAYQDLLTDYTSLAEDYLSLLGDYKELITIVNDMADFTVAYQYITTCYEQLYVPKSDVIPLREAVEKTANWREDSTLQWLEDSLKELEGEDDPEDT